MSPAAFLDLALSLPETALGRHQGGADLRVAGKIFASPVDRPGGASVLKLTPEQRDMLCQAEPDMFEAVCGRGGDRGWTRFIAAQADVATATSALWMAWRNAAPPKLLKTHSSTEASS
jgi:hypothetical protein